MSDTPKPTKTWRQHQVWRNSPQYQRGKRVANPGAFARWKAANPEEARRVAERRAAELKAQEGKA